ncbi:MAG: tRNA pseudouridine(38-40) synthase TruA [Verrucomicrobia bacterium]|nr:MAG: tRNA pseudouridine(38-40) synthase TruA [Verrucomicrobiota bacterium]TAE88725.1 MAG: tRNA pseudouridine(38-40) synthase TruA [Verrucomicrobiota bacterium]TAF26527.1 MAG: tRNA pseudouridine(38-40) synthase TruA [Verrucomicrobiota bacterium]
MRLKLTIAYDGVALAGWQSQPGGNTVQDFIESAIAATAKQAVRIHGSGRTDAGVHALGQIAHFDVPEGLTMNPFNWVPALNTKLPASIRVLACEEVAADFHARHSAQGKTYRYDLSLEPVLSPFRAGRAWHLPRQLDPFTLREMLACFEGRHDFEAFGARRGNETEETSYVRTITRVGLEEIAWGWRLRFTGDGFLYRMVRLMTGAAVQVAQGRLAVAEVAGLLDQAPGLPLGRCSHCAPADGLFLESVDYGRITR